jgi:hypothetical protein
VPSGIDIVSGERGQRCEVGTAGANDGKPGGPPDRRSRGCKLDGEQEWLLGRLAEKADLTLYGLLGNWASAG